MCASYLLNGCERDVFRVCIILIASLLPETAREPLPPRRCTPLSGLRRGQIEEAFGDLFGLAFVPLDRVLKWSTTDGHA